MQTAGYTCFPMYRVVEICNLGVQISDILVSLYKKKTIKKTIHLQLYLKNLMIL